MVYNVWGLKMLTYFFSKSSFNSDYPELNRACCLNLSPLRTTLSDIWTLLIDLIFSSCHSRTPSFSWTRIKWQKSKGQEMTQFDTNVYNFSANITGLNKIISLINNSCPIMIVRINTVLITGT